MEPTWPTQPLPPAPRAHWLAVLAPPLPCDPEAASEGTAGADPALQRALGHALLRFTPRVSLLDEAVLLDVRASLRLFGGGRALRAQVAHEARAFGSPGLAAAPTALGALARARCPGQGPRLDDLPLRALTAAAQQSALLARLGCRTLGDLYRLPRPGLARRFGAGLLLALDQARGLQPERLDWLVLPEHFDVRLELPGRVEDAMALMAGARRLLAQLAGWLAARQAGVRAVVLYWQHDFRPRRGGQDEGDAGQLVVRTAQATRDLAHLARLMGELLAHVRLAAPVGELRLVADEVEPLPHEAPGLALDPGARCREGESLDELLERLAARLSPQRVLRPVRRSDHRPEAMQRWVEAAQWRAPAGPAGVEAPGAVPQPAWLLSRPLPLHVRGERPWHAGSPLHLLSGAHRIEAGWWDATPADAAARDYFVAHGERAGLLWIYRLRPPGSGWFLHGVFG